MIAIIANPNALRFDSEELKNIVLLLKHNGVSVDVFFTQQAGDGTVIANMVASKYSIIAAYGGDGIINEIINTDLGSSALGILPAGTTNVLAIDLGIDSNALNAAKLLIKPKFKKVYLAKANKRRFILMAGVGFDGEAVKNVNGKLKRISGKFAYFLSGVFSYFKLENSTIEITVEGKLYRVSWVIISNAKKYAGRFNISDIDIDRPFLDVCIFKPILNRAVDLPIHNFLLFSSLHKKVDSLVEHITTKNKIIVKNGSIQLDGDLIDEMDAEISICDRPIKIAVP